MTQRFSFLALVICFALTLAAPAFAGQETPGQTQPPADQGQTDPGQGDQGQADQGQADQGKDKCSLLDLIKKLFCHPKDEAALKEAMQKLLALTAQDLQLCLDTISGKDSCYLKTMVPAVGNLNHALSALDKIHPPKHLKPVFKELHKRISHAKFYLVVNDREEAENRVRAALEYIGTLKS